MHFKQGCLAKGSKEGTGNSTVNFMVAVSYNRGAILFHQYDSKLNGRLVREKFSKFKGPIMGGGGGGAGV